MNAKLLLMLLVSGCASVVARPGSLPPKTLTTTGFAAPPGTKVTWFVGVFGCGIHEMGEGESVVANDGTFIVSWLPEAQATPRFFVYAFVDANQNGRCDKTDERAYGAEVSEANTADFSTLQPTDMSCDALNVAMRSSKRQFAE